MLSNMNLMKALKVLQVTESQSIIEKLKSILNLQEPSFVNREISLNAPVACHECGSVAIVKNGYTKLGRQRYRCKDCGKSFLINSDSLTHRSQYTLDTWVLYIKCMVSRMSVRKTAQVCEISYRTAFIWRHKILDTLGTLMNKTVLEGEIQADETYFALSFKGRDKSFMGLKGKKRGTPARKRGLSREKVCVVCGVDGGRNAFGQISSMGKPSWDKIKNVFNGHIGRGSTLVTDSFTAYRKSVKDFDVKHVSIPSGNHKYGKYHINLINAYHRGLKDFIDWDFKGVSTKYLNNYIVWFNLMFFAKKPEETEVELTNYALNTKFKESFENVQKRPLIPIEGWEDYIEEMKPRWFYNAVKRGAFL